MLGLLLTLLYVLTAYLAPVTIFGSLAEYRIELILAVLTMLASLPKVPSSELFRSVQSYALPALVVAIALSIAGNGWVGGAAPAVLAFVPNVAVFFFIGINCRTRKQLFALVAVLLFAALFVIGHAAYDIHVNDPFSPYLLRDRSADGETFFRIRGLALINDPNDLAQFMVGLTPCVFMFWRKRSFFRNTVLTVLPVCILVYGLYLTHSRGGMLALLAVVLLAARPKIGTVPAAVTAGVLFLGFSAVGWSGGRDISAASGADRMGAWSAGLTMIKSHPLIGVGLGRFQDFYEITAHNTIVVCSTEVGLLGYFSWMMFVLPSVRDAIVGTTLKSYRSEAPESELQVDSFQSERSADPMPTLPHAREDTTQKDLAPWQDDDVFTLEEADDSEETAKSTPNETSDLQENSEEEYGGISAEEARRLSRIMLLSISGFLTAGWFLSRAFVLSLFLLGGMIAVVYRLARRRGAPEPMPFGHAAKLSMIACLASLAFVYVLLRVTSLIHH